MNTTENQRFRDSIKFLKSNRLILNDKDFLQQTDWDRNRLSYLKADNGGTLTNDELKILKEKFPQINWMWVKLDEGSMLHEYPQPEPPINLVEQRDIIYRKKPELDQLLSEIILGTSTLPLEEQLHIARQELVRLQQKVIDLVKL